MVCFLGHRPESPLILRLLVLPYIRIKTHQKHQRPPCLFTKSHKLYPLNSLWLSDAIHSTSNLLNRPYHEISQTIPTLTHYGLVMPFIALAMFATCLFTKSHKLTLYCINSLWFSDIIHSTSNVPNMSFSPNLINCTKLTHRDSGMPCGITQFGHYWFIRHQAITWTNAIYSFITPLQTIGTSIENIKKVSFQESNFDFFPSGLNELRSSKTVTLIFPPTQGMMLKFTFFSTFSSLHLDPHCWESTSGLSQGPFMRILWEFCWR